MVMLMPYIARRSKGWWHRFQLDSLQAELAALQDEAARTAQRPAPTFGGIEPEVLERYGEAEEAYRLAVRGDRRAQGRDR